MAKVKDANGEYESTEGRRVGDETVGASSASTQAPTEVESEGATAIITKPPRERETEGETTATTTAITEVATEGPKTTKAATTEVITTEAETRSEISPENPLSPEAEKTQTPEEKNSNEEIEEGNSNEEMEEDKSGDEEEEEEGNSNEEMEEDKSSDEEEEEEEEDNADEEIEEDNSGHDKEEEEKDNEDDATPLQPEKFYFGPEQYTKVCKIGSRCLVKDTVNEIKKHSSELKWFTNHPQFRHIFHMAEEPNRKPMGLWMLLLHQACTDSTKELWFVVNGVPIRYSIREHALLSGLDCHDYPRNYNEMRDKKKGDFKFVERMFGRKENIKIEDVEEKLQSLRSSVDKKKMAVLYFLSNVLKAKSRNKGNIEAFLLKVVDDLGLCKTFPWGRYTFDDCIDEVKGKMKKFKKGIVRDKDSWTFSGFILPLEAFAFECIPSLGRRFRVEVDAEKDCPRLCKHKFAETSMKGYPLEDINEAIGTTKDIISILEPDSDEEALMERIIADDCDDGIGYIDPIVEGWRNHLIVKGQKIWWNDLYDMDLAARDVTENVYRVPEQEPETAASLLGMKEAMERIEKVVNELVDVVEGFDGRLKVVESFVKEQRSKGHENIEEEEEEDKEKSESDGNESDANKEKEKETREEPPKKRGRKILVESEEEEEEEEEEDKEKSESDGNESDANKEMEKETREEEETGSDAEKETRVEPPKKKRRISLVEKKERSRRTTKPPVCYTPVDAGQKKGKGETKGKGRGKAKGKRKSKD